MKLLRAVVQGKLKYANSDTPVVESWDFRSFEVAFKSDKGTYRFIIVLRLGQISHVDSFRTPSGNSWHHPIDLSIKDNPYADLTSEEKDKLWEILTRVQGKSIIVRQGWYVEVGGKPATVRGQQVFSTQDKAKNAARFISKRLRKRRLQLTEKK